MDDHDDLDDHDDVDGHDDAPAPPRPPSRAAAAPNWRTVVAVDTAMGVAVVVIGMVLAFTWQPVVGAGMASLGLVYAVMAARRGTQWAQWRRDHGLD